MWIRLRFDIATRDLASGMLACCLPLRRESLEQQAEQHWSKVGRSVVCLSVRSGFDLLLSSLRLPRGSEVLMSALTVPDMERIAQHHGLVPVPVDLIRDGCTPALDSLQLAVTSKTRVLVIAHLFGTRVDMDPILDFARRHNLFVIEDCAQAFHGDQYQGHTDTDAALFSFGPIKSATALGGGVIQLKSADLAGRLREIQHSYHEQSRRSYFCRLAKYSVFKLLASRPLLSLIARGCRVLSVDLDRLVSGAARNFPAENLVDHLRQQPSAPLLKMLLRRWRGYDAGRLQQRMKNGQLLAECLEHRGVLDHQASFNNFWVFPILVDDPAGVVALMRSLGFDATSRTRLTVVAPPDDRPELEPLNAAWTLARIVFLPWYPELPPRLLTRMARALSDVSPSPLTMPTQEIVPRRVTHRSPKARSINPT